MDVPGSGNYTSTVAAEVTIASEGHWIISLILSFVVILANLWIAIAFIHHVITSNVLRKKKSRRDVNGGLVMILAIASVTVPFFRYAGTLFLLFVSLYPEYRSGCELANDLCVAGFGLAVLPTYGFLWARQRAFYGHPSLGHMFGTCVGVFSKVSLVLIILSAVVSLTIGIYPVEYEPRPEGGCELIGGSEEDEYRTYVYAIVMISSQLVLLGLFLHPIRIHAQSQKGIESSGYSTKSEMSERSSEGFSDTSDPSATITNKNGSITTTEEKLPLSTISNYDDVVQNGHPKQNRSASLPSNNNIKLPAENHTQGSTDLLKIPENDISDVKRSRSATVKIELKNPNLGTPITTRRKQAKSPSIVPNAVARLKNRVRRSTVRTKKVYRLIRRILYLALISISSDLTVMIINAFVVPDDIPQTYAFVMYDCNLLINVITVVLSFENWRKMMLSPCSKKVKK
uniref:uncharacterized protein LOC120340329 n=1 Tax=Styela clava TaxID=7725 RepID=UPI00193AA41C|nr:uncharacterized protein LOC120340329 [Styela clava]